MWEVRVTQKYTSDHGIDLEETVQVLSNSEINNALGVTNSSNANTVVLMTNGDGLAQKVHVEGSTYLDGAWHATFNQNASSGSIRINYVIFYFGK